MAPRTADRVAEVEGRQPRSAARIPRDRSPHGMRVGLVLGAGGVVGASWLIGALEALESETGWRAAEADCIVGTSAGSVIGTLVASGLPVEYISAYAGGRPLEGMELPEGLDLDVAELEARESGDGYKLALALPPIGPGSWRMALSTLRNPLRHSPSAVLCCWLPRGFVSTAPISRIVDKFVPGDWPEHPNLWVVGCDYVTARRAAFGRGDAPSARICDAVAASCAIPAFYHPVKIGGRRYVDGGICSVSNADLLGGRGLDAVVVLNPMSSRVRSAGGGPVNRVAGAMRAAAGRRLGHEVRKLREEGTEVLVLQPTADDLDVMGANLMSRNRRAEVMEMARRSTALELRSMRGRLPKLAGGRGKRAVARRRGTQP